MERLYCDASYYNEWGGMSVVAPLWLIDRQSSWRSRWGIRTAHDSTQEGGIAVFYAGCRCRHSGEAEQRALGMAFLVAYDIIAMTGEEKVEIVTDSTMALSGATGSLDEENQMLRPLQNLWRRRRIILSKVKGHAGNVGNELADKWAKHARRETDPGYFTDILKEENYKMKVPYMNNSQNTAYDKNSRRSPSRNPFDGASEMDIVTLTERVLSDDREIGYVTSDGKVMPRNDAFAGGYKDGIELVKERVWGKDSDEKIEKYEQDGNLVSINVIFSEDAIAAIRREAMNANEVETGGTLIGTWEREEDGSISISVERASGPGARAMQKQALFSPMLEHYRNRVSYYREKMGWDYLGEWHKHPGTFDSLSATDINTARMLLEEEGWPLLLLPVVTNRDGIFFIDSHILLSRQLDVRGKGKNIFYAGSLAIEPGVCVPEVMSVYIDDSLIRDFRALSEENADFQGVCNAGESYVFVPSPGPKNARLRLVRAGEDVHFKDIPNYVTAIVFDDDVHCYHVKEGEISPLKSSLVDPEISVYERNSGLFETNVLRDKTITLLGCGSLGSSMALSLARAGVGTFRLFDFDSLSPANIARHQGDLRDLGRNKAAVTRDRIHWVNPALNVEVNTRDVVEDPKGLEALEDAAAVSDLLICATDTDTSRMLMNDLAANLGVKSLQVGLHERAASGIVHLYDPEKPEACFACHRRNLLSESAKRAEGIAYSEARDVRDLTVQPGLSAQIDLVAQTGVLRAIDALMEKENSSLPSLSIVYVDKRPDTPDDVVSEHTEDAPSSLSRELRLRIAHVYLERVKDCLVCGHNEMDKMGVNPDDTSGQEDEEYKELEKNERWVER